MNKIVYHGSSNGDIKILTSHKSTHQKNCIYATPSKTAAFLFMSKGNGDLDTRKSYTNEKLELVERRPDILNSLYNKEGYLYELDSTTFKHYDYLWHLEVISFEKEIKPLKKIFYPNILNALIEEEQKGNIIIYRYPNRPKDMPLDNSDLIEKYINFEKKGISNAISSLLEVYPEFKNKMDKKGYNEKRR